MARLAITVTDAAGAPVEGAFLTAVSAVRALPEMAFQTDASGEVQLDLPDGPARLRADAGGRNATITVDLAAPPEPDGLHRHIIVLPAA